MIRCATFFPLTTDIPTSSSNCSILRNIVNFMNFAL